MASFNSDKNVRDVFIVGGSYAGLSTATTLYRANHTITIFDSNNYRGISSSCTRQLPSFEGQDSAVYRARTRAELVRTGLVEFVDILVTAVRQTEHGLWQITDVNNHKWLGRKVVLATGVEDVFPDIRGYAECWVSGIFPCMFQFGYEERGAKSAGVLIVGKLAGVPAQSLKLAGDANKFAQNVTLYTNGNPKLGETLLDLQEGEKNFAVDNRNIRKLTKSSNRAEVIVEFDDGECKAEGFLVHQPITKLRGPLAQQLGLEMSPTGEIKVAQPFPVTSVPGVYAAGDCASPFKVASMAITSGVFAGNGVARELPIQV